MTAVPDARLYWIWLQQRIPPGRPEAGRLLHDGVRPEQLYAADKKALEKMGLARLTGLQDKSLAAAQTILKRCAAVGHVVLTPDDGGYPETLRALDNPPLVLYAEGEIPDWRRPAIGVVGTRRASPQGQCNAAALAAGLAAGGMLVISGGAEGIDTAAHRGAIQGGGVTVLVKPKALDDPYPPQSAPLRREVVEHGGLLLSEYPPGWDKPCDFHVRNRLIAGLSLGVCLVEAPGRSGSLITAHAARDLGREVFVLPGEVSAHKNDGGHEEVRAGAILITRAEQILQEYLDRFPGLLQPEAAGPAQQEMTALWKRRAPRPVRREPARQERREAETLPAPRETPAGLSSEAAAIYTALTQGPLSDEELAQRLGLSSFQLLPALTELEVGGYIECLPGGAYTRAK